MRAARGSGSRHGPAVVLASGSPQRREILAKLGIEFEVVVPGVEELTGGDPEVEVLENARLKARAVEAAPGAVVIACDTDVVLDGKALGKPADEAEARAYLDRMSGRPHTVLSGLVVLEDGEELRIVVHHQDPRPAEIGVQHRQLVVGRERQRVEVGVRLPVQVRFPVTREVPRLLALEGIAREVGALEERLTGEDERGGMLVTAALAPEVKRHRLTRAVRVSCGTARPKRAR